MLPKLYIGTNTKMYKTIEQTCNFLTELDKATKDITREEIELFVIPSFTALSAARSLAEDAHISLGAQNMGWEDEGQFTGEISPLMLKEVGVKIIEIGHSERRHVLGEDDEMENRKVHAALRHGFTPLLCIGETEKQKSYNLSDEVLQTQLKIGLWNLSPAEIKKVWIAYEPVWAIGVNGLPASKEYAEEKHIVIRNTLNELCSCDTANDIPVLYGGSVNNANAEELICMSHIDGLFIGRSAWDAKNFNEIIRKVLPLHKQKFC